MNSQSLRVVTLAIRSRCLIRLSSPKKSPTLRIAMVASFPVFDSQLDLSRLNVENRFTRIALSEDGASLREGHNFSPPSYMSEERLRVERFFLTLRESHNCHRLTGIFYYYNFDGYEAFSVSSEQLSLTGLGTSGSAQVVHPSTNTMISGSGCPGCVGQFAKGEHPVDSTAWMG